MIENIRKFKGLIILGLALVIFALVIGIKDDLFRGGRAGSAVLKIGNRTYDDQEFQSLGSGSMELCYMLFRSQSPEIFSFLQDMTKTPAAQDVSEKFFISRMILREAKEQFGVYPADSEVAAFIRGMSMFADKDGKFDEQTYRNFVEKGIGRLGMTETDLHNLVSDILAHKKISSIVGSGFTWNREVIARNLALQNQQIDGELASLSIDPYQEKIQPTEEEIKTYWENLKDSFTTEPLRKFSYIIVTPEMPAEAGTAEEEKESIADAAATDEAKKKKEEEKAKKAAELAEARRKKQNETDKLVDDFSFVLEEQKGAGFEELAKANQWEIKTTELFPQSKPPKELDVNLRSTSRGGKAVDELFRMEITSDPVSKFSQPIAIGENQWLIARLDGEEKSRAKTYEEAKDEARAQYISEKAAEALKNATTEAFEKIKASLAAGKSFAEAAKEAGIAETKPFAKVTQTTRPDAATQPRNLFEATRNVDPGSLAEAIIETDRSFILHVAKREVVKQADAVTRIDSEVKSGAAENESSAFQDWICARIESAKVQQLYKR